MVIDRQRQLRQIGTIRLGYSTPGRNGGKTPRRSDTIRLTSPDKNTLEGAARLFGGTVVDFPNGDRDKYLLVTERTEIPIGVTAVAPTQWMEHWDKGACQMRCNGETICGPRTSPGLGMPCVCKKNYPNPGERYEAAKVRKACKIVTRVSVMLPDAPDIGVWRMDTRGEHAADELMLTLGIIQSILDANPSARIINCTLAIEWRTNTDKQPYPVPVIRIHQSFSEITHQIETATGQHQLNAPERPTLTPGAFPISLPPPDDADDYEEDDSASKINPADPDGVFRAQED